MGLHTFNVDETEPTAGFVDTSDNGGVVGAGIGGLATAIDLARAGGPIRDLSVDRLKITDKGIDVVEAHVRRFDGGGPAELAMVERLRNGLAPDNMHIPRRGFPLAG